MPLKKKSVFSAEPDQIRRIQDLVRSGKYRSSSEFLREAIDEKLAGVRRELLTKQVASYCEGRYPDEDANLVAEQAFDKDI